MDHWNYVEKVEKHAEFDADESKSHLCNSLNAMWGYFGHLSNGHSDDELILVKASTLKNAAYYFLRAQTVINYLKDKNAGVQNKC